MTGEEKARELLREACQEEGEHELVADIDDGLQLVSAVPIYIAVKAIAAALHGPSSGEGDLAEARELWARCMENGSGLAKLSIAADIRSGTLDNYPAMNAIRIALAKPHPTPAAATGGDVERALMADIMAAQMPLYFVNPPYREPVERAINSALELAKFYRDRAALSPPSDPDVWQPIETAPSVKGKYFFCQIAWGPDWDKCTGAGFRWNGRWFAAAVFYNNARFDECQNEFRQIEVNPTHWAPSLGQPAPPARTGKGA